MHDLLLDLRFALRNLARQPGSTAVILLTLALGIGANTAIFSLIDGVLLKPLPYGQPDRVVRLQTHWTEKVDGGLSAPEFLYLEEASEKLEKIAAFTPFEVNLTGRGEPERITAVATSAGLFTVLGVDAALGRTFLTAEDLPGGPAVTVLSHELWQRSLGGDPGVVGQTLALDGQPHTIVGILPPGLRLPADLREGSRSDVFVPLQLDPVIANYPNGNHFLDGLARLAPGASAATAQAEVDVIVKRMREERGFERSLATFSVVLQPLDEVVVGSFGTTLLVLFGAVGFVLLIACANVANLLLARAETRRREIALRSALGAGRGRIVRQLLTESLLLATGGGVGGALLAAWGLYLVRILNPGNLPRVADATLAMPALVFTVVVVVVTALVFGLLPAFALSGGVRRELQRQLGGGVRGGSAGPGASRTRNVLVAAEMAVAVVLMIGAGPLLASFWRLAQVDAGFDSHNVLTFQLALPEAGFPDNAAVATFLDRLQEHLERLPGVVRAGAVTGLPLASERGDWNFRIEGRDLASGELSPRGDWQTATPGYFEALAIPLVAGRGFTAGDDVAAVPVALLGQSLAERYWPGTSPVGQRIRLGGNPDNPWTTVVGVVGDVRHRGLDAPPPTAFYVPNAQWPSAAGSSPRRLLDVVVKTSGDPLDLAGGVRTVIADLAPQLPVAGLRTLDAVRSTSLAQPRFVAVLLGLFAAVALALSTIGILGVLSFYVARRQREMGIRLALGAGRGQLLARVVGQGLRLSLVGLGLGLVLALGLTRVLASLLYGVSATDPLVFALVPLALLAVALGASYFPARRAASVAPVTALRHE